MNMAEQNVTLKAVVARLLRDVADLRDACVAAFYEDLNALKTIVERAVTWALRTGLA